MRETERAKQRNWSETKKYIEKLLERRMLPEVPGYSVMVIRIVKFRLLYLHPLQQRNYENGNPKSD